MSAMLFDCLQSPEQQATVRVLISFYLATSSPRPEWRIVMESVTGRFSCLKDDFVLTKRIPAFADFVRGRTHCDLRLTDGGAEWWLEGTIGIRALQVITSTRGRLAVKAAAVEAIHRVLSR
jgi:hypothetical protein